MPRIAKSITDIRAEARKYTMPALRTLIGIAQQPKAPPAARVAAAQAILDRGWGKAAQVIADADGAPIKITIELVNAD